MRKLSFVLMAVIAISFIGCKKEMISVSSPSTSQLTMYHGDTRQITAESDYDIKYSSQNDYHATVSDKGLITAQYVGTTIIKVDSKYDSREITVTVSPRSKLYPGPNISIGETKSSIIERFGEPDVDLGLGIGYRNYSTKTAGLAVIFDDNQRCTEYTVLVKEEYSSEIDTFLSERYNFYYGVMYIDALDITKATMKITASSYDSDLWEVDYKSSKSKIEIDKADIDALLKAFN